VSLEEARSTPLYWTLTRRDEGTISIVWAGFPGGGGVDDILDK